MSSRVNNAEALAAPPKEAKPEDLPLIARLVNHLLTPGSSLTSTTWTIFNVIMFLLFCVWLTFVAAMPDNIHIWIFGFMFLGLAASTNWLMKEIFDAKEDFKSQQERAAKEAATGGATSSSGDAASTKSLAEKKNQ